MSSSEQGGADGKKQREGRERLDGAQSYQARGGRQEKVRSTRYGNADTSKQEVALMDACRSRWKHGRRRELLACTIQANYRIATCFISQITPKFVWKLKNLQK